VTSVEFGRKNSGSIPHNSDWKRVGTCGKRHEKNHFDAKEKKLF
jgi:hypothetical protein